MTVQAEDENEPPADAQLQPNHAPDAVHTSTRFLWLMLRHYARLARTLSSQARHRDQTAKLLPHSCVVIFRCSIFILLFPE